MFSNIIAILSFFISLISLFISFKQERRFKPEFLLSDLSTNVLKDKLFLVSINITNTSINPLYIKKIYLKIDGKKYFSENINKLDTISVSFLRDKNTDFIIKTIQDFDSKKYYEILISYNNKNKPLNYYEIKTFYCIFNIQNIEVLNKEIKLIVETTQKEKEILIILNR
ncbi:hypothetical protein [Pseudostreptobacillus hongkongensis]|uniref:hypothetical protein n=1 Tax=Pseudostreptobacillus hongkongensis TaxID=1162717 RepID=UPI000831DA60|nr:hypothetical protein [Pseudostreptobacillus hongkongensis]